MGCFVNTLRATTPALEIGYESGGPANGPPVLLVHGWPDDIRTYDGITPALQAAGMRTFAPWLRGYGPTRFRDTNTIRSGEVAAIAQDMLDFADAAGLNRFRVVGHDWGARVAYTLAGVAPDRVERIVAMSVGWAPGEAVTPPLEQAQAYWYQWFMSTQRGAEFVRRQPKAFARHQWDTWGPPGWFTNAEFERTAESFENPDWADVTLHYYRVRWGEASPAPGYAKLTAAANAVRSINVPTLLLHGTADRCVLPQSSDRMEQYFTAGYRRELLEGIGHFPTREAPGAVADLLVRFLA
jgi:pimeloyl-ACP methyl ester carboxylesterase